MEKITTSITILIILFFLKLPFKKKFFFRYISNVIQLIMILKNQIIWFMKNNTLKKLMYRLSPSLCQ